MFKEGNFYQILWNKNNRFYVPAKCILFKDELYLYNMLIPKFIKVSEIDLSGIIVK